MGKWDGLTLPALPAKHREGGQQYQDRINLKKDEIRQGGVTSAKLAQMYRLARKGPSGGKQLRSPEDLASALADLLGAAARGDFAARPGAGPDRVKLLEVAGQFLGGIGKEELKMLDSKINLEVAALEQLVIETYQAERLSSVKMEGGASLGASQEPHLVVSALVWVLPRGGDDGEPPDATCSACRAAEHQEVEGDGRDPAREVPEGCECPSPECRAFARPGREVLREWLAANGHGEMLETLLPVWQTLNSMLKERLEENLEPMPGVRAFMRPKLTLRGCGGGE